MLVRGLVYLKLGTRTLVDFVRRVIGVHIVPSSVNHDVGVVDRVFYTNMLVP